MRWEESTFPLPVPLQVNKRVVEGAYLTAYGQGPLRSVSRPDKWYVGAVHDAEGRLVRSSQRIGGLGKYHYVAADPWRASVPSEDADVPWLRGRWLYGGNWMNHFGHFLGETLTTLWPNPDKVGPLDGLVFHRGFSPFPEQHSWQQRLVERAGYGDLPVIIVSDTPSRVERLVVPARSLVIDGCAEPQARRVWRRVSQAERESGPDPMVYLTRTALHAGRRTAGRGIYDSAERDLALDDLFARRGFAVVAPETLSIDQQLRLVRGARVLAGPAGSALHLAAFARPGTDVLELGGPKSRSASVPMQQVINASLGHRSAFAPYEWGPAQLESELKRLDRHDATLKKQAAKQSRREAVRG